MENVARTPFGKFMPGWFLLQFVCIYTVLDVLYFSMPDRVLRDVVHYYGIVAPGAELIKLLSPSEQVVAIQGSLQSPHVTLNIVRGCRRGLFRWLEEEAGRNTRRAGPNLPAQRGARGRAVLCSVLPQ